MWKKCSVEDLPSNIVFRGASKKEAEEIIKKGHAIHQYPSSLIGNDWEVLEYGFPEIREMSPQRVERFLQSIVPEWATKQGVNLTTDLENAKGYAQSRPNGKVLAFDINQLDYEEIFQPSEAHIQAKAPEKVKLVAICNEKGENCVCKLET
jgi:hypothetical protein